MSSPSHKRFTPLIAGTGAAAIAAALIVPAAASAAVSEQPTSKAAQKTPLSRQLATAKGPVTVMVELGGTTATQAYAKNRSSGKAAAAAAARTTAAAAAPKVADLARRFALPATRGHVLFSTTRVFPGVAVTTDASRLRAIAALPGVARVLPMTAKTRSNARSDEVTHALNVWQDEGNTGTGVTIASIDTGVDYTHVDFGGGGAADFARNDRTHIPSQAGYSGDVAFPTDKVVSGYDFAGDDYSAGQTDPAPDPDPGDCATDLGGGHGTHTSGTMAGFGVNADGTQFKGDYSALTKADIEGMNVGPGAAPTAKLSALRVFGCGGSTNLVSQALDYIAGLNTDSSSTNDVQIANLSLGSDFTRGDDPDAQAIDSLTDLGVLSVISAGNAGDLYGATGSPGTARRAITVAATDDGVDTVDGARITIDGDAAGSTIYPATNSVAYPYRSKPADNTNTLVKMTDPTNLDGCAPFNATDKAAVVGKYVFLEWDDNTPTRRCGSVGRSANAKAAGAAGSVFGSNMLRFSAGITGDADIPVTLINKTGADAVRAALEAGKSVVATFGFNYRAGQPLGSKIVDIPSTDKIADFTSRGGTPADGYLKPDVGAPGLHTFSANSGTGNEGLDESGTSMAAPHTSGTAALVKSAHPGYTPEEIKAALVNTASGQLTTGGQGTGTEYGVGRVGAGRIDGFNAVTTDVLAFVQDDPGAVGLGFGPVAVTGPTTRTKTVEVENFGTTAKTYALSYASGEDVPGVTFTTPASVTVPAGTTAGPGTATYDVTMRVTDVSALRKTPDPTVDLEQVGLPRDFIAEEGGRILMTPSSGQQLRLHAAVAVRPASSMHAPSSATTTHQAGSDTVSTGTVPLTGQAVSNGPIDQPTSVNSLVGAFQLQANSPALNQCIPGQATSCLNFPSQRDGDLHYVGATATGTSPSDVVGIALTTYGSWISPGYNPTANGASGELLAYILVDTDGDTRPNREIDITRVAPSTDVLVAETYDLTTGETVDDQYLNAAPASTDTNVFNSNSMIVPVSVGALGLTANHTSINYTVTTISGDDAAAALDTVGPLTFDVAHPGVRATSPDAGVNGDLGGAGPALLSRDVPRNLGITRDTAADNSQNLGLLLLHLHNADSAKADVVSLTTPNAPVDSALSTYVPVTPVRLLDTRSGLGAAKHAVGPGGVVDVTVTGGASKVPSNATAVVLTVTGISPTVNTNLRAYPKPASGSAVPNVSNLNVKAGRNVANTVVSKFSSTGQVRLRNDFGSVNLAADIAGYYVSGMNGSPFTTLATPVRALDTRAGSGNVGARPGAVGPGQTIDLKVAGANGIPANATAVAINLTGVSPTAISAISAYPKPATGAAYPTVSNLNVTKGVTTAALAIVKVGSDGSIRLRNSTGSVQLLGDIAGYYAPGSYGQYVALTSQRVLDTRPGTTVGATAGPRANGAYVDLQVAGVAGIPSSATSVVLNVAAVNPTGSSYVQVFATPASGTAVPNVSSLNTEAGVNIANLVVVRVGPTGKVRLLNSGAATQLLADAEGYYTG